MFQFKRILTICSLLLAPLFSIGSVDMDHMPGEILLMLKSNAQIKKVCSDLSDESGVQFQYAQTVSEAMHIHKVSFSSDLDDNAALHLASRHPDVVIAQFNHTNISLRSVPNDTLFHKQWPFLNDGTNGGSGLSDISAVDAWNITTGGQTPMGDTIVVAVIDQGFQVNHPDLIENLFVNRFEIPENGIDDDDNGFVDDVQGWDFYSDDPIHPNDNHGTHVAGTVGARGNNEIGVTGVNWNVKILPITGSSTLESTVVSSYDYVLRMRRLYNQTGGEKGAYIVSANSSFGVNDGDPLDYPLWCAMFDSLGREGVLSVGATANDDVDVDEVGDIPTACDSEFLITVTNMRSTDEINSNAGFGLKSIDLGAPGTAVYSTRSGDAYGLNSGTSMAAPHVAGTIGLMYSAICPKTFQSLEYSPDDLALYMRDKLLNNGVDYVSSLDGITVTGGRLNLSKSIQSVSNLCPRILFDVISSQCDSCSGSIKSRSSGVGEIQTYLWSTGANSDSIGGLCAGIYSLTVVDVNNDSVIGTVALSDSGGPDITVSKTDLSCYDSFDGMVEVTGGYNHHWQDGPNGTSRNNLQGGAYYLTATDSLGICTTAVEVEITVPAPLSISYDTIKPSSDHAADGSITISVSGGQPPYEFIWENGETSSRVTGLSSGKYAVTVSDNNECLYTDTIRLGFPVGGGELFRLVNPKIFPNPTRDYIFIQANSVNGRVQVLDLQGRIVMEETFEGKAILNVNDIVNGVYFINLSAEGWRHTEKIIIQHE